MGTHCDPADPTTPATKAAATASRSPAQKTLTRYPRNQTVKELTPRDTSRTTDNAGQFAEAHLPAATVKGIVEKTLNGTLELTFNPALRLAVGGCRRCLRLTLSGWDQHISAMHAD